MRLLRGVILFTTVLIMSRYSYGITIAAAGSDTTAYGSYSGNASITADDELLGGFYSGSEISTGPGNEFARSRLVASLFPESPSGQFYLSSESTLNYKVSAVTSSDIQVDYVPIVVDWFWYTYSSSSTGPAPGGSIVDAHSTASAVVSLSALNYGFTSRSYGFPNNSDSGREYLNLMGDLNIYLYTYTRANHISMGSRRDFIYEAYADPVITIDSTWEHADLFSLSYSMASSSIEPLNVVVGEISQNNDSSVHVSEPTSILLLALGVLLLFKTRK